MLSHNFTRSCKRFSPQLKLIILRLHLICFLGLQCNLYTVAVSTDIGQQFRNWIGNNRPSLYAKEGEDTHEVVDIDLPEYDLRKAMTGRDPPCCTLDFAHTVKHILPSLYGWRMCPTCPDCCNGDEPCMNMYRSNATSMGESLGRVDAAVGAVEAQKAEGVLHLHMFLFLQMAHQYLTLAQIAEQIRQGSLSATSFNTNSIRRSLCRVSRQ